MNDTLMDQLMTDGRAMHTKAMARLMREATGTAGYVEAQQALATACGYLAGLEAARGVVVPVRPSNMSVELAQAERRAELAERDAVLASGQPLEVRSQLWAVANRAEAEVDACRRMMHAFERDRAEARR